MPIVKITGQGLMAIAFSVVLLWACLIGNRVLTHRAHLERARLMRDIHLFQRQRTEPVAVPTPLPKQHIRVNTA